jgi:hypothetical protein
MRIAFKQMSNEVWLIVNLPINTIFVDVLNPLLLRHQESRDATRSLAKHSKKEQVPRTALALAANGELVRVPCLCPVLCVPMDRSEEEMMKEPYMARASGIKAMIRLEVEEKYLPFLPKAMCHIVPEAFDAGVVDASEKDRRIRHIKKKPNAKRKQAYRPQMKDPRPLPFTSSRYIATSIFSTP